PILSGTTPVGAITARKCQRTVVLVCSAMCRSGMKLSWGKTARAVGVSRSVRAAAYMAAGIAFASAATTAYWVVGRPALLHTLSGSVERLAREPAGRLWRGRSRCRDHERRGYARAAIDQSPRVDGDRWLRLT